MTFGFAAAVLLMVFFAVRTVVFWAHWTDPEMRNLALEGWMTPGFVARSWHVDRGRLSEGLGLDPRGGRQTLSEIAAARGIPLDELEREIMAIIIADKVR